MLRSKSEASLLQGETKVSPNHVLSITYNIYEILLCDHAILDLVIFEGPPTRPRRIEVHIHYSIRDTTLVLGPCVLDFDSF